METSPLIGGPSARAADAAGMTAQARQLLPPPLPPLCIDPPAVAERLPAMPVKVLGCAAAALVARAACAAVGGTSNEAAMPMPVCGHVHALLMTRCMPGHPCTKHACLGHPSRPVTPAKAEAGPRPRTCMN
eukprot:361719-Chlamydomonas_euryale.AAC.6